MTDMPLLPESALTYDYGRADGDDDTIYGYGGAGTNSGASEVFTDFAEPFLDLLQPARYKVFYGGRGSAKSWHFARALLLLAVSVCKRILCCREYQSSINESVHYILCDQIMRLGLSAWFEITDKSIYCPATGSEFIFKGLRLHINEIKSTEGVDICWIEEGQAVSRQSWNTLDPTIRAFGSEIWISYNPLNDDDAVHDQFVIKGMPTHDSDGNRYALVKEVNYVDNPWFPADLEKMRQRQLNEDQDIYAHVWLGKTLQKSDAMVFINKCEVKDFTAPEGIQLYYGVDWGYSQDPNVIIRSFILDDCLYIEYEAFGHQVDLNETPALFAGDDNNPKPRWENPMHFRGVPGAQNWPIKGDNSRPESISYVRRCGLAISAADKWPGSVEDGIAHLRAFKRIYIHTRCVRMQQEALMYRYKVDKKSGLILPLIVDAYNHGWDAVRYSLDGYIQRRGSMGLWARLGQEM